MTAHPDMERGCAQTVLVKDVKMAQHPALPAPPAYTAAPPMIVAAQQDTPEQWQTSLFGCCADWPAAKTSTKTLCCPCIAYGATRDRIMHQAIHGEAHPTRGNSCTGPCGAYAVVLAMPHFGPIAAAVLRTIQRTQMRTLFGIAGHPIKDCLASTFCGPCSLVQTQRELDIREREGQVQLIVDEETTLVVVDERYTDSKEPLPEYRAIVTTTTPATTDVQSGLLA